MIKPAPNIGAPAVSAQNYYYNSRLPGGSKSQRDSESRQLFRTVRNGYRLN